MKLKLISNNMNIVDIINSELFSRLWLIIGLILSFAIVILQALAVSKNGDGLDPGPMFALIMCAVCWPFVLILALILAPFFGVYWLTLYIANKIKAKKMARKTVNKSQRMNQGNCI